MVLVQQNVKSIERRTKQLCIWLYYVQFRRPDLDLINVLLIRIFTTILQYDSTIIYDQKKTWHRWSDKAICIKNLSFMERFMQNIFNNINWFDVLQWKICIRNDILQIYLVITTTKSKPFPAILYKWRSTWYGCKTILFIPTTLLPFHELKQNAIYSNFQFLYVS